jgi:hypothetical protein
MIETGDSHWRWHVDQLVAIHADLLQAAVEWEERFDGDLWEQRLEQRRAGFAGGQEAWEAAVAEARRRVAAARVVPFRARP